jgi:hemoglobin-like flavoprotein
MTPDQVSIVQRTWAEVVPIADQAAALFYDRLFAIDPALRQLFAETDRATQQRKLVAALALAVGALDDFEALRPTLGELGRRHAGYGVADKDYETVGAALLWTLEQGLGEAWTPDAAAAWSAAYAEVAGAMTAADAPRRRRLAA